MTAPQLFDRLSRSARTPSLRDAVVRDVLHLINSAARGARLVVDHESPVSRSILNFGDPPLAGFVGSDIDPKAMAAHIREIVQRFEPRVHERSVRVVPGGSAGSSFDLHCLGRDGEALSFRLVHDQLDARFRLETAS